MHTRLRRSVIVLSVVAGLTLWTIKPAFAAEPVLTGLVLAPGVTSLVAGQTTTFTLTGTYSDATTANVTEQAAWTVNGGGFTGIPGQRGVFTAHAVGTWTVTAALQGLSATASITITHGAPVALTLMPTPASVTTDEKVQLRLFAADADGNGWDVTASATWTTNEPTGSFHGTDYVPQTAGSWTMDAALGTLHAARLITVTPGAVQTVSITPATIQTVMVGQTTQLQASVHDADGNLLQPAMQWTVTNPAIGTVNDAGLFTALAPGQTNILASAGGVQTVMQIVVAPSVVGTSNDPEIVAVTKPTTNRTPRVAAEEVEREPDVTTQTPDPVTTSTKAKTQANFPHPWVIVLVLLHVILLAGYFTWLMQRAKRWWWAPPIATTAILLGVYQSAFTKGTYLWWPWTIIGLTIIFISVYYQRYGPSDASPGNAPNTPPQT